MTNTTKHLIREVEASDLPALAAIEKQRWTRENTPILSLEKLEEWYQTKSPFFLVSEKDGVVEGYYYGMQIHFSLETYQEYTSADARTDQGYTVHTHDPTGTSVYGVNVVTIAPEAGALLNAEVHRRLRHFNAEYFIGFTRLVHLDRYLSAIEETHGGTLPYDEPAIALWYAHETMRLIDARKWEDYTKQADLALPALRRPDTILKFHVQGTLFGLLDVVSNYMEDPKSRNYGAFIVSSWPHVIE